VVQALVECHSGASYGEEPRAFQWQGIRNEVEQILIRWRNPMQRVFVIRNQLGERFRLTYDELEDEWTIEPC